MPQFKKAIKTPDPKVVQGLVEKTSILIENKELRRQMGKAGRWEVEHGKFSVDSRSKKLKRIFDEATA
jgi:glycosyltransferase involved in cell wall biosynthesis